MFRILSVLLLLAMGSVAAACQCTGDKSPCVCAPGCDCVATELKADAAFGVAYTQEQVLKLPQDQNKLYVTVIGDPSDAKYRQVRSWFASNPDLKSIRAQVHYNEIETTSSNFTERLAKSVSKTPCIRVQTSNGETLFQVSGQNVPMTGEALNKNLNTECFLRWRRNHSCPCPKPGPAPQPEPGPGPDVDVDVDVQPDVAPANNFPWIMLVGAVVAALGAGVAVGFVKKFKETYRMTK